MHKSRSVMTCAKVTLQSYMVHDLKSLGPEILSKFKAATWKQMHSFYPRCYFASLRMNCCGLQVSPIFDLVSDAPYAYQLPTSFRGFSQKNRFRELSPCRRGAHFAFHLSNSLLVLSSGKKKRCSCWLQRLHYKSKQRRSWKTWRPSASQVPTWKLALLLFKRR